MISILYKIRLARQGCIFKNPSLTGASPNQTHLSVSCCLVFDVNSSYGNSPMRFHFILKASSVPRFSFSLLIFIYQRSVVKYGACIVFATVFETFSGNSVFFLSAAASAYHHVRKRKQQNPGLCKACIIQTKLLHFNLFCV